MEWFCLYSLKNMMFLSPLARRWNSTLKYWQLYRIQLLKWSSRYFNMELEALGSDSISIWSLQIAYAWAFTKPQTAYQIRKERVLFCRTFISDLIWSFATEHSLNVTPTRNKHGHRRGADENSFKLARTYRCRALFIYRFCKGLGNKTKLYLQYP